MKINQKEEEEWIEKETKIKHHQQENEINQKLKRDTWMLTPKEEDNTTNQETNDYLQSFASIVSSRKIREKTNQEINNQLENLRQSSSSIKRLGADDPSNTPPTQTTFVPGGPGYQWRMSKLKRTYEAAREENRPIEQVALERYGDLESWNQALKERDHVEEQQRNSHSKSGQNTPKLRNSERRYMFTNREEISFSNSTSRPNSRSGFRKPNSALNTPEATKLGTSTNKRLDEIRSQAQLQSSTSSNPLSSASSSVASTPIASVIDPLAAARASSLTPSSKTGINPSSLTTALNKLQASILKAQIMNPEMVPELEKQYNQLKLSLGSTQNKQSDLDNVQLIPTLDGRGRMYDVGNGDDTDDPLKPGNKRKKQAKFEIRDRKTGELLRINPDDDKISLNEMVRQEKLQAGSADQKNLDAEMATRIMSDSKFQNDLDYMDDNADQLARKKMKTDASKRLFAINDYKRTQKALETCQFCFKDDGNPPSNLGIISTGTKVYLSCTQYEELVEGHCLIVPIQHALCSLELDDDVWDEIKNYMKCLMRMFSEKHDKGVVFYETILSFKNQSHTYIEAVPLPWDLFNDIPAYFRESINSCESEWSQHRKLIDFSDRPGGFRRSMVSKLPYFMIQWDYKGEKGFGHVIEGNDNDQSTSGKGNTGAGYEDDINANIDDGLKGGKFPRYFAAEIIGNLLELEPSKWRKPKRILGSNQHKQQTNNNLSNLNSNRVNNFLNQLGFSQFNWTHLL